jgi:hypothetical protein
MTNQYPETFRKLSRGEGGPPGGEPLLDGEKLNTLKNGAAIAAVLFVVAVGGWLIVAGLSGGA